MAYTKSYNTTANHLEGFGQKVKNVAGMVGTIKGIFDAGKTIYSAVQTAAPYIEMASALI